MPDSLREKAEADTDEADVDVAQEGVSAEPAVDEAAEESGWNRGDERDEEVVRDGLRPEA